MNVVALDISLTCTGLAEWAGTRTIKPTTTGMERLQQIRGEVLLACQPRHPIHLVAIEGYAMGTARQPSRAHALGELGGVVRLALWEAGIPFINVAPSLIKKYATGAGNAKKDAVFGEAIRRLDYAGSSHDEADALWLYALVKDAVGEPIVTMPAKNREAVAGVMKLFGAVGVAA